MTSPNNDMQYLANQIPRLTTFNSEGMTMTIKGDKITLTGIAGQTPISITIRRLPKPTYKTSGHRQLFRAGLAKMDAEKAMQDDD